MKKITLFLCLTLSGSFLFGCSKDEILDNYNTVVQHAGSYELTNKRSLVGTRDFGIDDYTGTYVADYKDFSKTEYLFGGTTIKREHGKDVTLSAQIEGTSGTVEIFWLSGSDEPKIIASTNGDFKEKITLPEGGNYFGIKGHDFTGQVKLTIE